MGLKLGTRVCNFEIVSRVNVEESDDRERVRV